MKGIKGRVSLFYRVLMLSKHTQHPILKIHTTTHHNHLPIHTPHKHTPQTSSTHSAFIHITYTYFLQKQSSFPIQVNLPYSSAQRQVHKMSQGPFINVKGGETYTHLKVPPASEIEYPAGDGHLTSPWASNIFVEYGYIVCGSREIRGPNAGQVSPWDADVPNGNYHMVVQINDRSKRDVDGEPLNHLVQEVGAESLNDHDPIEVLSIIGGDLTPISVGLLPDSHLVAAECRCDSVDTD